MAIDATGTPSTNRSYPKINTAVDAPSGKGINAIVDAIDVDVQTQLGVVIPDTILDSKGDIIAATAADTPAKLTVGSNGQVLSADSAEATGLKWITPATATTYRKATSRTVNTTTSATDLLNGEITIGAGVLTSTGVIKAALWGDWLQNSGGASDPPRFQLVLGGTTLLDTGTFGAVVQASATRAAWKIEAIVAAANSTSAQTISWEHMLSTGATTYAVVGDNLGLFTTGSGQYQTVASRANSSNSDSGLLQSLGFSTGSKDMTASQTFVLNVINGSSSANYETKLYGALLEVI